MALTICIVGDSKREWSTWLGFETRASLQVEFTTAPSFQVLRDPNFYRSHGRTLALIHGVPDFDIKDCIASWNALNELRGHAWWLFYNGTGYQPGLDSDQAHCLRYDISYDRLWPDERNRFLALLSHLTKSDAPAPTETWNLLYPPDNVPLATLLALLCADEYVGLGRDRLNALVDEESLRLAFDRYSQLGGTAYGFGRWRDDLENGFDELRRHLASALGSVPD